MLSAIRLATHPILLLLGHHALQHIESLVEAQRGVYEMSALCTRGQCLVMKDGKLLGKGGRNLKQMSCLHIT